jgi:hypothetical protein
METPEDLAYPVIAISASGFVYSAPNATELQKASSVAYRRRFFEGLRLIDQEGRHLNVVNGVRGEVLEPWWRHLGNAIVRVNLELEPRGVFSLEQAKAEIQDAIRRYPDLYESEEDGLERILSRVAKAPSLPALAELFLGQL